MTMAKIVNCFALPSFLVMKFGGDAIVYGLLAATYPAFQLIGSPILGKWSDIYGRKKVLLLSKSIEVRTNPK